MSDRNRSSFSEKKFCRPDNHLQGLRLKVKSFDSKKKVKDVSGVSREDIRKLIAHLELL